MLSLHVDAQRTSAPALRGFESVNAAGPPVFWLSCDTLPSLQENLHINGPTGSTQRLPNTLSISIRGLQATQLLEDLSSSLAASAGAACHSGQHASMSHVLEAMQVRRRAWAPWVAEPGPAPCMPAQIHVLHQLPLRHNHTTKSRCPGGSAGLLHLPLTHVASGSNAYACMLFDAVPPALPSPLLLSVLVHGQACNGLARRCLLNE